MPDLRQEPREAGEDIVTEEQQLGHAGGPQGPEHLVQVVFSLSLVVSFNGVPCCTESILLLAVGKIV